MAKYLDLGTHFIRTEDIAIQHIFRVGKCDVCGGAVQEANPCRVVATPLRLTSHGVVEVDSYLAEIVPLEDGSYGCEVCS